MHPAQVQNNFGADFWADCCVIAFKSYLIAASFLENQYDCQSMVVSFVCVQLSGVIIVFLELIRKEPA